MSDYTVWITHPERQHSHQFAMAMAEQNTLERYIHGAPIPTETAETVPATKRRRLGYCRYLRVVLNNSLPSRIALEMYYRLIWSFDFLMSHLIPIDRMPTVVGYENAVLHQFRRAKSKGLPCILDNSGVHHELQAKMIRSYVSNNFMRKIVARKDEELALADLVLTCSSFAAESFIAGGVPKEKIRVVPLGCDTKVFGLQERSKVNSSKPMRFLFVGRLTSLKGVDLLAAAAQRLQAEGLSFVLTIAAPLQDADPGLVEALRPVARLLGKVPYDELPVHYAEADCLIAPSRFDSFGFVVAEAMASGVPVIVSDHVGSKDMVENDRNGWIVPAAHLEPLLERMEWCVRHPDVVRAMSADARETAKRWSFPRYRSKVAQTIDEFMTNWSSGAAGKVSPKTSSAAHADH